MPRQPAEESSDWLSGLQESPPAEGGGAAAEDEDWLKNLQSWSPGTETPAAQEPAPASETPDWLSGLPPMAEETPAAQEPTPAGETPDWLSGLPPMAEETPAAQEPTPAGETPDWLSGLPPMAEETPAAQEPTPAGETPDWLSGLPTESAEAAPAEEIPVLSGEIPDWLKGSMPVEPIAEEASTEAVDWMKGMPVENEPAAQATPAGEEEGTPDWLKAYAEPPGSVPLESQPAAAFPAEDMAEWLAPEGAETSGSATSPFVGSAGLGTDWEGNQPGEGVPAATPAFSFDVPPNEQTPESELPFSDQELPDWLASGEETQAGAPAAAFEGIPEDLAPADLPTWVAAMRPVESAAPLPTPTTQDDQRVENLGPLAGVKGVLPSQDVVVQYAKPPIYSVKLQVTDRQRLHSNLLEAMLNEENQPRTVAHELTSKSARWFRLGVALILLAALLIPLIFGGANPIPAAISAPGTPAERLYNEINSVSGSPVLLIVDYEPGLSAELHIAAEGVVQHLMEKSDSLAVISSSPTGPILAEKLLSESYPLNNLSVNLGYVPGGTTALQALVSDLRGTLREPLRGSWDHPALQGIQKLSDFKQVILLTGNDQSARDWIEQIQPALGDTPLLVISSAQAAPMLQPYADSGQIKVLMSGLVGGAAYQQLHQSPSHSSGDWLAYYSAYQAGIAVAIALIVIGLLLQLVLAVLNQAKQRKGG